MPRVAVGELTAPRGEASSAVRPRVVAARERQRARGGLNRQLRREVLDDLEWAPDARRLLADAVGTLGLTARGWDRVRRVAVTVADLADSSAITADHVAEALGYRSVA
jgi:magnesium chelatase family protein